MNDESLIQALRGTMDPSLREAAERQLNGAYTQVHFVSKLLQVTMCSGDLLELPVKQAAVIYLKNMVTKHWSEEDASGKSSLVTGCIPEEDKKIIRENIIQAVILSPKGLRVQLATCIHHMIKHDYPDKWTNFVETIIEQLRTHRAEWLGILLCLYQLVKNYENKKPVDLQPLVFAMDKLMPMLMARFVQLQHDPSSESVLVQKQILKILHALIHNHLPLELINRQNLPDWMQILKTVVDKDVPPETMQLEEDERANLPWWKCKKWAIRILSRLFQYAKIADFLKRYAVSTQQVLLKVLHQYKEKQYVAPTVLQQALVYINNDITQSITWKNLKPEIQSIIQQVVFPLLCHSDSDEELCREDPSEYIRLKFPFFEADDDISPSSAATTLLYTSCNKRKEVLSSTVSFCNQILQNPTSVPQAKDGALNMIGSLADILLKKKGMYKDQMETFLNNIVFPMVGSELGFMRARACWVLHCFSGVKFTCDENLKTAVELMRLRLIEDDEMPVKATAAFALQDLVSSHNKARDYVSPNIKRVMQTLLALVRDTMSDEFTTVLEDMVKEYAKEIIPITAEVTQHLAMTFRQMIDGGFQEDRDSYKMDAAMGIIGTITTLLDVVDEHKDITQQLESICLRVIDPVLEQHLEDLYSEILEMADCLTRKQVSPQMWQLLPMLHDVFQQDDFDYMVDIMPLLHNYVTVDTDTLLSNMKYFEVIFTMCKKVLTGGFREDVECYAAKLMEVIILQCKGRVIDQVVPMIVNVALERLTRQVETSELRTMCLQVAIAALYYNPALLFNTLHNISFPNNREPVINHFITQWLKDIDCFLSLHDMKMSVLGLCTLMGLEQRPQAVNQVCGQLLRAIIQLFNGLKKAYTQKAKNESEEGADNEEDEDSAPASDEDDIDVHLDEAGEEGDDDDDDYWDDDDEYEEVTLDDFTTPVDAEDNLSVDEYQIFKSVLQTIETRDPVWYQALMQPLDDEHRKLLRNIGTIADQRRAVHESKMIEKRGGYKFEVAPVPTNFNFGGNPPAMN